jgi:LmbE family N-acetylglucosaminyl deacetylase
MNNAIQIALILALLLAFQANAQSRGEQNLEIRQGERLLVLAPHPDDESLSSAGLIKRVFENGGSVRSVVVTAGDAYVGAIIKETGKANPSPADYLDYGEKRLEESRRAAQLLGQGFVHLDLLGFSDGNIYAALVNHWRRKYPMRSDYTGFDHVPYAEAEDRGIAQDGQDLHDELLAILRETKPTLISFPDVMENDSDHAGLGMFVLLAIHDWLSESGNSHLQPRLLAYLIHWQHGWPKGSDYGVALDWSDQPLYLPDDLPLRGHSRECLTLNTQEINLKRQALGQYQTQQRAMGDFLSAFVRKTECFSVLNPSSSRGINNVLEHWRHSRKSFDYHPMTRRKI